MSQLNMSQFVYYCTGDSNITNLTVMLFRSVNIRFLHLLHDKNISYIDHLPIYWIGDVLACDTPKYEFWI